MTDVPIMKISNMWNVSSVLPRSFSVKLVTGMDISHALLKEISVFQV